MQTRPLIRKRFGQIETEAPYSEIWVRAVKECVPPHFRNWNGSIWSFDPSCYSLVQEITDWVWPGDTVDLVDPEDIPRQFYGWETVWERFKERIAREDAKFNEGQRAREAWRDIFGRDDLFDRFFRDYGARDSGDAFSYVMAGKRGLGPHQILYVTPNAPWEVVEAAYRALAKKHHPDKGGDTARMQQINEAYAKLKERHNAAEAAEARSDGVR